MTIFDLIKRLQELGAKHGNLEVEVNSSGSEWADEPIGEVAINATPNPTIVIISHEPTPPTP